MGEGRPPEGERSEEGRPPHAEGDTLPPELTKPGPSVGTLVIEEAQRARVRRFRLSVAAGPDAGTIFVSKGQRTVVGSHEGADLVLDDRTVSRFHCEITLSKSRVLLRDLGSRNGTEVNGVRVVQAELYSGALLAIGRSQLRFEVGTDHADVPLSENERFGVMVGRSTAMRAAFAILERAAQTDTTILIEGETGTGKEAAAESIHRCSPRREGPLIVVDCGAIPADLLGSELFGHERGAFTGAVAAREGAFEAAGGGTLFLDEIGELPPELQPKLLRALERREVKRVGSNRYLPVDLRVVAASNRSLCAEVNARRFRSDLYYRLAVVTVRLPPLRERQDDLPLLVDCLLEGLGAASRPEADGLRTPRFIAELARHHWPGNTRELRNYLERCLALRQQAPLPDDGSVRNVDTVNLLQPLKVAREAWNRSFERRYLEGVLGRHGGNISAAAREAGVDRMYFYRLLWRHGLR